MSTEHSLTSSPLQAAPSGGAVLASSSAALPSLPVGVREWLRRLAKRGLDLIGATALLVALSPVLLALWAVVRLDGGPAIYSHRRVGRRGQDFSCLKFRSMSVDAEARLQALLRDDAAARAEWETTRKLRQDPRVTRIGRFLRSTSLDELPQLLNVIRGEMSLVGPRPVTRDELDQHYGVAAAHYGSVRPGITGPWQVGGRSDTTYRERVDLDVDYATNSSFRRDLAILLRTPLAVLLRRGAC